MNGGDDRFVIRPFNNTEADLMAVLEVYRQCEDFLALGPVPTASLEMVQSDLEHSKEEGGVFCLICSANSIRAGISALVTPRHRSPIPGFRHR